MNDLTPHYSPYMKAGNLIFTSGQLPLIDTKLKISATGIEAQTRLVLEKIENLLRQEGLSKNDIVKTTAFLTNIADWDIVNAIYKDFFGEHKPARSIIPVGQLHYGCLIELEAVAYVGD